MANLRTLGQGYRSRGAARAFPRRTRHYNGTMRTTDPSFHESDNAYLYHTQQFRRLDQHKVNHQTVEEGCYRDDVCVLAPFHKKPNKRYSLTRVTSFRGLDTVFQCHKDEFPPHILYKANLRTLVEDCHRIAVYAAPLDHISTDSLTTASIVPSYREQDT